MSMIYHQPFIRDETQIGLPFFVRIGLLGEQGASELTVSPTVITAVFGSDTTLTANLPSTWSAVSGTLVVAGDNLSAVYTAPGSGTSDTITVTSIDTAQVVEVPVALFPYLTGAGGTFVIAAGVGTLVDSGRPGAYGGGGSSPAPNPLLSGLVAAFAVDPSDALTNGVTGLNQWTDFGGGSLPPGISTTSDIFPGTLKITADIDIALSAAHFFASSGDDFSVAWLVNVPAGKYVQFFWVDGAFNYDPQFELTCFPGSIEDRARVVSGVDATVVSIGSAPADTTHLLVARYTAATGLMEMSRNGGAFQAGSGTIAGTIDLEAAEIYVPTATILYMSNLLIYQNRLLDDSDVAALYNSGSFFNVWTIL